MQHGMSGPDVRPLPPGTVYDPAEISSYITRVLKENNREGAYGIFAGFGIYGGQVTPTLIFGIPEAKVLEPVLAPAPFNFPILVRDDRIIPMNDLNAVWSMEPVRSPEAISLEHVSLGIEESEIAAGSFGGFLRNPSTPETTFAITAAHCVPGALVGVPICSPSTVEVTSRFRRLLRYSELCPTADRLRHNSAKDAEAKALLERFRLHDTASGLSFQDPTNSTLIKKGILLGDPLGSIVSYHFGRHRNLLYSYDQHLAECGYPHFYTLPSFRTTLDWCVFSCHQDRVAGNIYQGERIEEVGDLFPGAMVEMIGRSTGPKSGQVNEVFLQHWTENDSSYEIAIIGDVGPFANVGDSGGCVFVNMPDSTKAAGMLVGKNALDGITFATPLRLLLESAQDYTWE